MNRPNHQKLLEIFTCLLAHYGPQHWWPAEEPFEVMVGAILTQSAAWTNVEKAIHNLKTAGMLNPASLRSFALEELAGVIHSCGYYNMKARKLKALAEWFSFEFSDNLEDMQQADPAVLRTSLLGVYGVGEETADSILLYACEKPVFVIDAYTRRIVDRLGFRVRGTKYSDYQSFFLAGLKTDIHLFNEYHALLVALGKTNCKKKPLCRTCCLADLCEKN